MKNLIYFLIAFTILSCNQKGTKENTITDSSETESKIQFTAEQIELGKIETGKVEKTKISESVKCTGTIDVLPNQKAAVSPIIPGFITSVLVKPGEYVEKGKAIAKLHHPEFIAIQKDYIEAKSNMDFYEQEYKRQGELTIENAASIKKMQKAKADFLSAEANYKSLKATLELLNVDTEKIEKQEFEQEFTLLSPISGTITKLEVNKGKHFSPEDFFIEIINCNKLLINLNVFEKDIHKLKKDQLIIFSHFANNKNFKSKIADVGSLIDPETKTILVQGNYNNLKKELNPGMHVSAEIYIDQKEVYTLPKDAIVENQEGAYVFIKHNDTFNKIKIEKGIEKNDRVEIKNINENILNKEIVIHGAYYIMSAFELNE